jgi:hypothetical protein
VPSGAGHGGKGFRTREEPSGWSLPLKGEQHIKASAAALPAVSASCVDEWAACHAFPTRLRRRSARLIPLVKDC